MTGRVGRPGDWLVSDGLFGLLVAGVLALALLPPAPRPPRESTGATAVTDMAGRTVKLDLPARRVVIFPLILSNYLTINKGADGLVAAARVAVNQVSANLLGRIYPVSLTLPAAGSFLVPNAADAEQMMNLRPDVILSFVDRSRTDPLVAAGIPGVVEIAWQSADDPNEATYRGLSDLIGQISGHRDREEALWVRFARERNGVLEALGDLEPHGPTIAQIDPVGFGLLGSNWMSRSLHDMRVTDVGEQAGIHFSQDPEQLIQMDPDVILIGPETGGGETPPVERFYAQPEFRVLRAVRQRRVYQVPMESFANAFVEEPLLLRWLAEVLYPDQMPTGLRADYRRTYREVFDYTLTDDEIDAALHLEDNLASAGYRRFARTSPASSHP